MALKQFTTDFQELSKEKTFRYDFDFLDFQNDFLAEKYYSFNQLFGFSDDNKIDVKTLEDDFLYSEIGNVSKDGEVRPVKLNFSERNEEYENYYKKIEKGDIIKAKQDEILLSKVRPNLKKYIFVNDENSKYYYTSAFIHLSPKKINKILYYALRTVFYKNLIAVSRQGKGYPTLREDDFSYLKFDKKIIDKFLEGEDKIVSKIKLVENKIIKLKTTIKQSQDVINKIFAIEFRLDLEHFMEIGRKKFFEVDFSKLSIYHSIRMDAKYHKNTPIFENIIKNTDYLQLKDISLSEPMYGANESAEDGQKGEDTRYIRITDIDILGNLIDDDWKTANTVDKKYLLKNDDFLFARSGNTVAKSFLYNNEKFEEAIFAGYFIKFHLDFSKINKDYFLYYTKSFVFEFWRNGIIRITGQPNINANEYLELKIPNISPLKQKKIVDEIKAELDKQEEVKKTIKMERDKIDEIIEKSLSKSK